jgi:nitrogen-specific signal transduction histidine kinase
VKNQKTSQGQLKESQKHALHYMQALIEVSWEPFLILDPTLRVLLANPIFYQVFHVTSAQTEKRYVFDLGDGQWNIPELKKLLEEILPKKKIVTNYEVSHVFETIGEKTMLLNARKLDDSQLIILAIEDITDRHKLEEEKMKHSERLETKVKERTRELAEKLKEVESLNKTMVGRELKMMKLKEEIERLKKGVKNGNGNGNHKNGQRHYYAQHTVKTN